MKQTSRYLSDPMLTFPFTEKQGEEFSVSHIGYNDFSFVKPSYVNRVQDIYTLHFVISGKGKLEVCGKEYFIGKHELFFLPPNEQFRYYPDAEDPWEYVFFCFSGTRAQETGEKLGFSLKSPVKTCTSSLLIEQELKSYFEKNAFLRNPTLFESYSLFFKVLAIIQSENAPIVPVKRNVVVIEETRAFIDLHFRDDGLTCEKIAKSVHTSHSYLCKLFKEETGTTLNAYLFSVRMRYAEKLLKETALSVGEIAFSSGFKEYTYFLRAFKKTHGLTAGKFRNRKNRN